MLRYHFFKLRGYCNLYTEKEYTYVQHINKAMSVTAVPFITFILQCLEKMTGVYAKDSAL